MFSADYRRLSFATPGFAATKIYAAERGERGSNAMQLILESRAFLLKLTYKRLNKRLLHICILPSECLPLWARERGS